MNKILLVCSVLFFCQPVFAGVDFSSNSDLISVPDHSSFRNMAKLSISAWFKRTAGGGGGNRIVSGWNDATNKKTFQLYLNGAAPAIELNCDTTGVNYSVSSISNNVWYNFIISYDGETVYLYIDGTEIGNSTTPSGDIKDENSGIGIGNQPDNSFFGDFDGDVSDVAIWNTNLSVEEVVQIAKSKVKGMPLQIQRSSLILYMPLDEQPDGTSGDGDSFYDRSGNGHVGTGNAGTTAQAEELLSYP